MSKIFEALKKAGIEGGESLPPLIAEELAVSEAAPAAGHPAPAPQAAARPTSIQAVRIRVPANAPVLPFESAHSRPGEQYRIIRTKILQHPRQPRMLVVSSAGSGDGKTVSAINVAASLALRSDVNVLLVDADFRRSSIGGILGLPPEPGLADVLTGACSLDQAVTQVEQLPNLYVLPSGKLRSNPAELLDSAQWRSACAAFRERFQFVVLDAPPMGAVADYDLIQVACDGVIFVARPDHTDRTLCLKALAGMPKEKLVGVLINCFDGWFLWKTNDYYYYSGSRS